MKKVDYTLYYWPVPFRGHFIRAILTYAGANWEEADNLGDYMYKAPAIQPIPFMGPPVLVDNRNGFATSQMSAIAYYLGEKMDLLPDTIEGKTLTLKIVNDANDLIDELTIQGGLEMWTSERWIDFQPRLKRWMGFWEEELNRSSSEYLLSTTQPTIADIVTATLFATAGERFPAIKQTLEQTAPKTAKLVEKLWQHELADFAKKSWATYGDSYCGGQIGDSLKKVVNGNDEQE